MRKESAMYKFNSFANFILGDVHFCSLFVEFSNIKK